MRIIVVCIVLGLIIVGALRKIFCLKQLDKRLNYTIEYREHFIQYCNAVVKTGKLDSNYYLELTRDINKIQLELGNDGIVSYYNPMSGIKSDRYPMFLNFFTELRFYMKGWGLFNNEINMLISSCDEALLKHIGVIEEAIGIGKKRIINPIYCFSNGIGYIISLPVKMLEWCGILNNTVSNKVLDSRFHFVVEKLFTIIGLVASVMTIIMGWDQFVNLIKTIIN
jgi:hypothetical protein